MKAKLLTVWIAFLAEMAGAVGSLSLDDARHLAFERNQDLLAARYGIDAAAAQYVAAREFPNPTVAFSSAKIGSDNATTAAGNGIGNRNYDSIAAVSQLLEIGGKREARQRSAGAGAAGATARFDDMRRILDQGVTKAYIAAVLAGDRVSILLESAGYLNHERDIADARFKAGDIAESDRDQIGITAAQYELQARSAETAAVQARIAVDLLTGEPQPDGHWIPAETLEQLHNRPFPPAPRHAPGMNRPDVLAAEADLRRANADLYLQRAMRVPDPTLSLQVEHNPPGGGPPIDTYGAGVSFPLPLWNRNGGNIGMAQAASEQAVLALEKARFQARSDLANAREAHAEAVARWTRYHDQIVPRSAKVRETIAFAYRRGGVSLVDLLEAERADHDIRLAEVQAMADAVCAAADLAAAETEVPGGWPDGEK